MKKLIIILIMVFMSYSIAEEKEYQFIIFTTSWYETSTQRNNKEFLEYQKKADAIKVMFSNNHIYLEVKSLIDSITKFGIPLNRELYQGVKTVIFVKGNGRTDTLGFRFLKAFELNGINYEFNEELFNHFMYYLPYMLYERVQMTKRSDSLKKD